VQNAKAMLEQTGWAAQREIYLAVFDDVLGRRASLRTPNRRLSRI